MPRNTYLRPERHLTSCKEMNLLYSTLGLNVQHDVLLCEPPFFDGDGDGDGVKRSSLIAEDRKTVAHDYMRIII